MRYFLFLVLLQQSLFGADPIGKVIALDGVIKAIAGSVERVLEQNSDIFTQETIVVGASSRAQLQFTDGGLMNLLPDTEFRINSYKYKKMLQKDESSSELLKGGLRTLSGSIAKKNPNGYEIKTPSGTIGLRGTIVEARLVDSRLLVGVESGRALVSNAAGSAMIGVGEKNQFAVLPGKNIRPELVVQRPLELERSLFNAPQGGLSIDQVSASQQSRTATVQPTQGGSGGRSSGGEAARPSGGGADASPTESVPSIGESGDDNGIQYAPSGGGASIQGGSC